MEKMSNLIDRQAAIDAMCLACGHDCDKSKFVYNAPQDEQIIMCPEHYALSTLPSAQPEPHWIPVSERLPEDNTLMLVNYVDHRHYAMDIWIGWHEMENVWYIDGETHSEEFGNEVVAWMPLPEPYAGRRTDD